MGAFSCKVPLSTQIKSTSHTQSPHSSVEMLNPTTVAPSMHQMSWLWLPMAERLLWWSRLIYLPTWEPGGVVSAGSSQPSRATETWGGKDACTAALRSQTALRYLRSSVAPVNYPGYQEHLSTDHIWSKALVEGTKITCFKLRGLKTTCFLKGSVLMLL